MCAKAHLLCILKFSNFLPLGNCVLVGCSGQGYATELEHLAQWWWTGCKGQCDECKLHPGYLLSLSLDTVYLSDFAFLALQLLCKA